MKVIISDFIIIGGGIVGLSIARNLKKKFSKAKVVLLEKEKACGMHASGRNSGVLHAGFYYTPDSLKAKFTKLGNQLLTTYCEERNIALNKCGKLVVAKDEDDLNSLDVLLQRAAHNGVILHDLTAAEAKKIEPRVLTYKRALFSPTTSAVNPKQIMESIRCDAECEGVDIRCDVRYLTRKKDGTVITTSGAFQAGFVVNAAGLYADKIAHDFNFAKSYRILPFKGIYLYSAEPAYAINTHIYPVPDLKNPFLGVHVTISAIGEIKLGPTAIPAFWREQYDWWRRFHLKEFVDLICRQVGLVMYAGFDFRKLAMEEIKKYSKAHLVALANSLATGICRKNFTSFGKPGIRAQLLNTREKKLEMDFIIEGDKNSLHILNAVSPGFTSALPFSRYVCDRIACMQ